MLGRRPVVELGEERLYFFGVIRLVPVRSNSHPRVFDVQRVPNRAQFGNDVIGFVRQSREIPGGVVAGHVLLQLPHAAECSWSVDKALASELTAAQ